MENKSSAPFCTCDKFKCPLHPVNHDKGCTLCIAKNLRAREIPNCYFDLLGAEGGERTTPSARSRNLLCPTEDAAAKRKSDAARFTACFGERGEICNSACKSFAFFVPMC